MPTSFQQPSNLPGSDSASPQDLMPGVTASADDQTPVSTPDATAPVSSVETAIIAPNLLNVYASYTPVITFQVAPPWVYNNMMISGKYDAALWTTICKSGGVGPRDAFNIKYFTRDLYLEDLELSTTVGINKESGGTNVTSVSFTIQEPNGMNFIEDLWDFCNNGIGEMNYCQLPYLLIISFRGFTQTGEICDITGTEKYIPLSLVDMKIKAGSTGASYQVSAIPYNELGNHEKAGRIPAMIELSGQTINDICARLTNFLNETAASTMDYPDTYLVQCLTQNDIDIGSCRILNPQEYDAFNNSALGVDIANNSFGTAHSSTPNGSSVDTGAGTITAKVVQQSAVLFGIIKADSATGAELNKAGTQGVGNVALAAETVKSYQDNLKANQDKLNKAKQAASLSNHLTPIDQQYANDAQDKAQKEYDQALKNYNAISAPRDTVALTYQIKNSPASVEYENGIGTLVRITAGAGIISTINSIIMYSDYCAKQINDFEDKLQKVNEQGADAATLNYPVNWFMVIPSVTINTDNYDTTRNCYACNYTYTIKPFVVNNIRNLTLPNEDPSYRVVKQYDYILTGKNTEVLNFDMEFNTSFITYSQVNAANRGQSTSVPAPIDDQTPQPAGSVPAAMKKSGGPAGLINAGNTYVPAPASSEDSSGAQSEVRAKSADAAATMYAPAEMLSVRLTINGDPDYIKQDGIFLNPNLLSKTLDCWVSPPGPPAIGAPQNISNDNSSVARTILFNNGDIWLNLNFLIPRDIDLSTGLIELVDLPATPENLTADELTTYKRNKFSGQYRVTQVTNKFNKGVFTQELETIRNNDSHISVVSAGSAKSPDINHGDESARAAYQLTGEKLDPSANYEGVTPTTGRGPATAEYQNQFETDQKNLKDIVDRENAQKLNSQIIKALTPSVTKPIIYK